QTVQYDERPFFYFERNEALFGPRLRLKNFKAHTTFRRSHPTRLQSDSMAGRHCPETAVLNRRVFHRKPEAHDVYGVIVSEGAVLVACDLASDPGLLEVVH